MASRPAKPNRLEAVVEHETFARLARSRDFLASSLHEHITLKDAAVEACLSPFHYHRMFSRAFAETPHDFITRLRIERAKELLARDHCAITDICFAVGYNSPGSFSLLFRTVVGCSPSEYRRAMRRIFPVPELAAYRFVPACFLQRFGVRPF